MDTKQGIRMSSCCTNKVMFVKFPSEAFAIKRQEGSLCCQTLLQVENWGAVMVAMKGQVIFCPGSFPGCVLV